MKIIVTAGGTGGHIHPALVVAEELKKMSNNILFVGGMYGSEKEKAEKAGFEFLGINVRGFNRSNFIELIKSLLIFPKAVLKAMKIISDFDADAVVGAGGYASGPTALAAVLKKIPLFLMEQNVYPGLVTRKLAGKAEKLFATFEESREYLGGSNVLVIGNPVGAGFKRSAKTSSDEKVIIVMGGSQGAHSINRAMAESLPVLKDFRIKVYHQAGKADLEMMRAAYAVDGVKADVEIFFDNMDEIMAQADLVVGRAGASTCAELAVAGIPSIMIPYRFAGAHQKLNAKVFADAGASVIVDDATIDGHKLAEVITGLITDESRLADMSSKALALGRPGAGKAISIEIMKALEV